MTKLFKRFVNDESGVTAIEYGLLAAALAAGVTALVGTTGDATTMMGQLKAKFDGILT